jgi:heat shock protein HslJ
MLQRLQVLGDQADPLVVLNDPIVKSAMSSSPPPPQPWQHTLFALVLRALADLFAAMHAARSRGGGAGAELTPAVLEGTRWTLTHWAPGEPARPPRPIEIVVEGGRLSGHAGCNRFFASLVAEGDTPGAIRVSPPGATRMACEGEAMQAETRFLGALGATTGFGFRMGRLVLSSSQGPGGLVLERR